MDIIASPLHRPPSHANEGSLHSGTRRGTQLRFASRALRGKAVALCLAIPFVEASSDDDLFGGSAGCPCINTSALPWRAIMRESEESVEGKKFLRSVKGLLYQRGYGSSHCAPHDNYTRTCREVLAGDQQWEATGALLLDADNKEKSWCKDSWCYVDPNDCHVRPGSDSPLLRQDTQTSGFFRQPLQYSYETCGTINSFDVTYRAAIMKKELRELPSFVIGAAPGDDDFLRKRGFKFLVNVLGKMGVTEDKITYRKVSNRSLSLRKELFMGSSWTACVHDVALGLVDACGPLFLDLPIRRRLAPMVRMTAMPMYLMGRTRVDESVWDLMQKPFRPFTLPLWVTLLLVMILVGCAMGTVEHTFKLPAAPAKLRAVRLSGDGSMSITAVGSMMSTESAMRQVYNIGSYLKALGAYLRTLAVAIYISTIGHLANGHSYRPHTGAGKIISAGYGFFLLVCMASYTANSTVFLFEDKRTGDFTDIKDAIEKGVKICIPAKLFEDMLTSRYPNIRKVWRTEEYWRNLGRKDVFDSFIKGDCAAFVESEFKLQHKHGIGKLCDVETVGRPIHSYGWGYPIRKAVLPHLSWGILESEMKGGFVDVEKMFPPPQSTCEAAELVESSGNSEGDATRLDTRHLLGTVLIVALTIVLGVTSRVIAWFLKVKRVGSTITRSFSSLSGVQLGAASSPSNGNRSDESTVELPEDPQRPISPEGSAGASSRASAGEPCVEHPFDAAPFEAALRQGLPAELSEESMDWLKKCIEEAVQRAVHQNATKPVTQAEREEPVVLGREVSRGYSL